MKNPFVIKAYESRELFCDRNEELQLMLRNCINHTDMTLISQRRIGKTGLILRLFDEIATVHPDIHTIYVDIFSSRNIDDFIKLLAEAIMKAFKPKTTLGEKLMAFIKTMRPQLTFDNITGEPQLMIAYQSPHEKEYTLNSHHYCYRRIPADSRLSRGKYGGPVAHLHPADTQLDIHLLR